MVLKDRYSIGVMFGMMSVSVGLICWSYDDLFIKIWFIICWTVSYIGIETLLNKFLIK